MIRKATILAVGKLRGWSADGSNDYLKRLRRYFSVEVVEVPEEDLNRRSPAEVLSAEATKLLKRLPGDSHVIVMDREMGRRFSSEDLAKTLGDLGLSGSSHVTFVLGGPLGLAPEVLAKADTRFSLGGITLPHALARVVLLEQLYRAAKISKGEKYHH